MDAQFNIVELKQSLIDFKAQINEMITTDPEYNGEADNLLAAIDRVETELTPINSEEEFSEKVPNFAEDLFYVLRCSQEFANESDMEDDEFDEDLDDEDLDGENIDDIIDENLARRMDFDLEISRYINREYNNQFLKSSEFAKLTPSQKEHAPAILCACSKYVSEIIETDYHDLFIEDMGDLCYGIFPNQFYANEAVFNEVPAVLNALFTFFGTHGLHDDVAEFSTFFEENGTKMIELLNDKDVWSPGKTFLMDAIQNTSDKFDANALKERSDDFYNMLELDNEEDEVEEE